VNHQVFQSQFANSKIDLYKTSVSFPARLPGDWERGLEDWKCAGLISWEKASCDTSLWPDIYLHAHKGAWYCCCCSHSHCCHSKYSFGHL